MSVGPEGSSDYQKRVAGIMDIAESLQDEIDARLLGETAGLDIDAAWDEALRQVAGRLITARLAALPPQQLADLYDRYVGDDEYAAKLRQIAAQQSRVSARQQLLSELQFEAQTSGLLAVRQLAPNETLMIALFKPMHVASAYKGSSFPPARTIGLRYVDPSSGEAEVVFDRSLAPGSGTGQSTSLPVGRRLKFGHLAQTTDAAVIESEISLYSPLHFAIDDSILQTPELIGYVQTIDGVVLLDGHPN